MRSLISECLHFLLSALGNSGWFVTDNIVAFSLISKYILSCPSCFPRQFSSEQVAKDLKT